MHLIFLENEEEKDISLNKCKHFLTFLDENLFVSMEKLAKNVYVDTWKTLTKEVKFTIVSFHF